MYYIVASTYLLFFFDFLLAFSPDDASCLLTKKIPPCASLPANINAMLTENVPNTQPIGFNMTCSLRIAGVKQCIMSLTLRIGKRSKRSKRMSRLRRCLAECRRLLPYPEDFRTPIWRASSSARSGCATPMMIC